jgi:hypothetical protein
MACVHSNPCEQAAENGRYTQNASRDKQNGEGQDGIAAPVAIVFD